MNKPEIRAKFLLSIKNRKKKRDTHKIKINCLECQKEVLIFPCFRNTAKFCNRVCMGRWNSKNLLGKNSKMFGFKHSNETKLKIKMNHNLTDNGRKIMVEKRKLWIAKHQEEHNKNLEIMRQKYDKMCESNPELRHLSGFYSKKHSEQWKMNISNNKIRSEKISKALKGKLKSDEHRRKIKENNCMKDPEIIKKVLRRLQERPVQTEVKLNMILQKNFPNEWKYTGDGSFLIGYKNPDFVNINGKKMCIEIYYEYFKKRDFGSTENYEKQRAEHFAKYGWKTIFIKSEELEKESILINKISGVL